MTVKQVVQMAQASELKSVSAGTKIDVVLSHLNLAMVELYKRFQIETGEVILTLGHEGTGYTKVSDTIYKLPGKCMVIIAAYDELKASDSVMMDNKIPINDESNPLSIMTIGFNTIQVPIATLGAHISIIYIANPTTITMADYENGTELQLPTPLLEPLLLYMGYRGNSTVKSDGSEGNTLLRRFEESCRRVSLLGMVTAEDHTGLSVQEKGYV